MSFNILSISDEDNKHPTVIGLLGVIKNRDIEIKNLDIEIKRLKDEIARLKGHPSRPRLKPSTISQKDETIRKNKRKSNKSPNKKKIQIHETIRLRPKNIPEGSKLIKSRPYVVQDIVIKPKNTQYIREIWKTPN